MNTPRLPSSPGTANGQDKPRVWIVDDDETSLLLAQDLLDSAGFAVETFADPLEALACFDRYQPDLIVLDVMMPRLDGFEFCSRLRSHPAGRHLPILMATSLDDRLSINRAFDVGATEFTTKPLDWQIETHRLRYLLRSADMARELRLREHETRIAKEDWENTFDAISDVVTLLTPDLRVIRANAAARRAVGRSFPSPVGVHCYLLYRNSASPCPGCPVLETLQTRSSASAEVLYQNPPAACLVSAAPVFDADGRLLHVVHVARDLTHQRRLEAEYRQAQKMEAIGTLAGGVAHDFNNILQVIVGYAQLLQSEPGVEESCRAWADHIAQAAARGGSLARQLLTFSRKGSCGGEKRPVAVNLLVRELQQMLERILPSSIAVRVQLAEPLSPVTGSADQLQQVLMNLAVNASQAMPDGGTLTLVTRACHLDAEFCKVHPGLEPGPFVRVTVSDTGCGIDSSLIGRIFEPFFTTKKAGEGTGLGLSVAYGIIQDHGGHIACDSTVGKGTTFDILLPAAPDIAPPHATPAIPLS